MVVNTSKLQAINTMLDVISESPVTTISENSDSVSAEDVLDETSRRIQSTGWMFNREEEVQIPVSALGYLYVPNDVMAADASDGQTDANGDPLNLVLRGRRMYNVGESTYGFTVPTNRLTDPKTFGPASAWTIVDATDLTIFENNEFIEGPHGGIDGVNLVDQTDQFAHFEDTSGAMSGDSGILSQTFTLAPGTEYTFSGYFRGARSLQLSPQTGARRIRLQNQNLAGLGHTAGGIKFECLDGLLPQGHSHGANTSWVAPDVIPPIPVRLATDPEIVVLDTPVDYVTRGDSTNLGVDMAWCFVRYNYVCPTGGENQKLTIMSSDDPDLTGDSMYIHGMQITPAKTNPIKLDLIRALEFDQLPETARQYIMISAARKFQARKMSSGVRERFSQEEEARALALLKREESQNGDYNIFDTFIPNVTRRRNPPLYRTY